MPVCVCVRLCVCVCASASADMHTVHVHSKVCMCAHGTNLPKSSWPSSSPPSTSSSMLDIRAPPEACTTSRARSAASFLARSSAVRMAMCVTWNRTRTRTCTRALTCSHPRRRHGGTHRQGATARIDLQPRSRRRRHRHRHGHTDTDTQSHRHTVGHTDRDTQ